MTRPLADQLVGKSFETTPAVQPVGGGNSQSQAAQAASPRRRLLARLEDACLRLLDRYVGWMGLDGAPPQAPQPPVIGTPYMGPFSEVGLWRYGSRYRRWGP